jgi:ribosomal protein S18 acetylase RimI-like enzyme
MEISPATPSFTGFRGLGIGTEMMKTLAEQATALELKVLMLHVFATNKRAVHFYEKVGFVQTGRVPMKHFREGRRIGCKTESIYAQKK